MSRAITIKDIEIIKSFKDVSNNSKETILNISSICELKKGQTLFKSKDNIDNFYAVLSGKVAMFRLSSEGQKRVFFILDSGDLINEVVFDSLPVSVNCEAFETSLILQIHREDFIEIMEKDFQLTINILNSIGRKQRRLYRQLKNTLPIGIEKKLAAKLWKLSKDYGHDVCLKDDEDEWKYIDLDISATYLSYMLGTSRESISRALKVLKNMGACKVIDRKMYVKENLLLTYYRT